MKYGLIGYPLKHSFSKEIHNALGNLNYTLQEISEKDLDSFLHQKDFKAINVTIPYKEKVIPYLDYLDDTSKDVKAVNIIVNKDNKLYGYNSDVLGLNDLIITNNINLKNKCILILGTGATSKTAQYVCLKHNPKKIIKVSRSNNGDITYDNLNQIKDDINVIINTTPNGMYPHNDDPLLIDLEKFKNLECVIDVIFNPLNTKLVLKAKELNIKAYGGLYMLVSQAAYADSIFFNTNVNKEKIKKIYDKCYHLKQNIVFIGMPSSGKSGMAKRLSKELHMEYFDSDTEIEKQIGMSIKDYIFKNGEENFRTIEKNVIKELSKKNHVIIATGGGVVLDKDNITSLKENGKIYFINRSLHLLKATKDRPLSSNYQALKEIYNERLPLYTKYADVIINGDLDYPEKIAFVIKDYR